MRRLAALLPARVASVAHVLGCWLLICVLALQLRYGLLRLPPEAAAPRLQALEQLLAPVQLLPFDSECAACAARLRVALEAVGTPIGPHDTLIAATALRHQGTLVTRNAREFARVPGLQWVNWHDD